MSHAVIRAGGKQFLVEEGQTVRVPSMAADPGSSPLDTRGFQSRAEVARIASISRELACNDPNSNGDGEGGPCASGRRRSTSEGRLRDRNVELLVRNPFPRRRPRR